MTYSPIPLIKGLIHDTQEYLLSLNIEISQKENEILELTLKKEFTKSLLTSPHFDLVQRPVGSFMPALAFSW